MKCEYCYKKRPKIYTDDLGIVRVKTKYGHMICESCEEFTSEIDKEYASFKEIKRVMNQFDLNYFPVNDNN